MAQFPLSESEILALAQAIITGLKAHPDEFPNPPVIADDMQTLVGNVLTTRDEISHYQALAVAATNRNHTHVQSLSDAMRLDLKYAEQTVPKEKWSLLGWGQRAEPVALQIPEQPRNLECLRHGDTSIQLDWKAPKEGGKVAIYHIERRIMPDGPWILVKTSFDTEIVLTDQPRGQTLEFRVIASNKAGDSAVSNSVAVMI
jgi:hypothetical protein